MDSEFFKIWEKHSAIIRFTHWMNVPLLSLMIWSGWLIYWAHQPYITIPDNVGPLQIHHRLSEGMAWHFFIMWLFYINGTLYVLYHLLSGEWRSILPNRHSFKNVIPFLLYEMKFKKKVPHWSGKYNPAQRIAYTGVILMGIGSLLTGLAIYKPVQLGWLVECLGGYEAARFEHFLLMIGYIVFIFIHVIQVARAGWNNFRAMLAGYEIEKE